MKDQEAKVSSMISLAASLETRDQANYSCRETNALTFRRQNAVSRSKASKKLASSQRGQIIVEYVLLLVFAVSIAILITKTMVSRDPGNPGFVVQAWHAALTQIGSDKADDIKRE